MTIRVIVALLFATLILRLFVSMLFGCLDTAFVKMGEFPGLHCALRSSCRIRIFELTAGLEEASPGVKASHGGEFGKWHVSEERSGIDYFQ